MRIFFLDAFLNSMATTQNNRTGKSVKNVDDFRGDEKKLDGDLFEAVQ